MRVISPGKFEVTIGNSDREIIVSLGLKAELYKIISKAQLNMATAERRVYLDPDISVKIQEADAALRKLESEQAGEEEIAVAKAALDLLYDEAMQDIQAKQAAVLEENVFSKIDLTERVFAEAISCLLSERDETGKVTNRLEPDVIMWSPVYGEAQEELADLLYAVTEYITAALKKISAISALVNDVTPSKTEKTPL